MGSRKGAAGAILGRNSAFPRKPLDRRLVREVTLGQRAPVYWTPMAITEDECKLMEVRKFSSDYFALDAKFRRPGLELITAYAVQNSFLWGQYLLRREQMKMQLVGSGQAVKEKDFFCKSDFASFEGIARLNFDPRTEANPQAGVIFYTDALAADGSKPDPDNIRIIIMAKVLVGTCIMRGAEEGASSCAPPSAGPALHPRTDLPVDTATDSTKTRFYKFNMSEVYPEFILVYRKKTGGEDTRSHRLTVQHVRLAHRAGARFNPQERPQQERDQEAQEDLDTIETAGVFSQENIVNVKEEEVTARQPAPITAQPKRSRAGFKRSIFGLFGVLAEPLELELQDEAVEAAAALVEE